MTGCLVTSVTVSIRTTIEKAAACGVLAFALCQTFDEPSAVSAPPAMAQGSSGEWCPTLSCQGAGGEPGAHPKQ